MNFVAPTAGSHSKFLLDGEAGAIECLLAAPAAQTEPVGISLICHPHPLYGGALSNKVTYSLAGAALDCGYYAMRFNFRGVGRSQGSHDQGLGEAQDTVLLGHWLRQQYPDLPLLLAGFSFGGFVSLSAAAQLKPQLQVSVAPPFSYFDGRERPAHPGCPWMLIHGLDDDVVPDEQTRAVLGEYQPQPELFSPDGVGHFFHGRLQELRQQVADFIRQHC